MTLDIISYRLHNQFLSLPTHTRPEDVVRSLGAVQSQDYAGAKWGLGLRMETATDQAMDRDFEAGKILRTHMLRPTWHFVAPEDIRWILALTSPRVHTVNGTMYRQLELDRATRQKSYKVLEKTLGRSGQLTRVEIGRALAQAGIAATGLRLAYIVMSAELDGLICSGGRKGRQFTYVLLEARVPSARTFKQDEALAELTRRYFATRGPATVHDFTWWSGLTVADAKRGLAMTAPHFASTVLDDKTYWFDPSVTPAKVRRASAHLLPNYDEYFIGFRDRSALGKLVSPLQPEENSVALNAHILILDGQIVGGWKRTLKKDAVDIEFMLIAKLSAAEEQALLDAASRYGEFMGLPVRLR